MCKCNKENPSHFCGVCVDSDYNKMLTHKYPKLFPDTGRRILNIKLTESSYKKFDNLCHSIQNIVDHHNNEGAYTCRGDNFYTDERMEQPYFVDIKEKFGSLCIYLRGGSEYIRGSVGIAQVLIDI